MIPEHDKRTDSDLRSADQVVDMLRRTLHSGLGDIEHAREGLRIILRRGLWKDRIILMTDKRQQYREFLRFVTDPPLEGLGTTLETLKTLAHGDAELEDLVDEATQRPNGGDRKSEDANIRIDIINSDRVPDGTSSAAALRRLRKDRPDLHAQVLAGDKTPHGAMVEAGFRRKTISIPIEDPAGIARVLIKHLTPAYLAELRERIDRADREGWLDTDPDTGLPNGKRVFEPTDETSDSDDLAF